MRGRPCLSTLSGEVNVGEFLGHLLSPLLLHPSLRLELEPRKRPFLHHPNRNPQGERIGQFALDPLSEIGTGFGVGFDADFEFGHGLAGRLDDLELNHFRKSPDDLFHGGGVNIDPADHDHLVDPSEDSALEAENRFTYAGRRKEGFLDEVTGTVTQQRARRAGQGGEDEFPALARLDLAVGLPVNDLSIVSLFDNTET